MILVDHFGFLEAAYIALEIISLTHFLGTSVERSPKYKRAVQKF